MIEIIKKTVFKKTSRKAANTTRIFFVSVHATILYIISCCSPLPAKCVGLNAEQYFLCVLPSLAK